MFVDVCLLGWIEMLSQTGSGLSVMLTPALSPSCWSVRTHKQDICADTYAAGPPVSSDLGWTSEALHGFHIPSSSVSAGSKLIFSFCGSSTAIFFCLILFSSIPLESDETTLCFPIPPVMTISEM